MKEKKYWEHLHTQRVGTCLGFVENGGRDFHVLHTQLSKEYFVVVIIG